MEILTPDDLSQPQKQAVNDILNKKNMCITSDCGFGKTVVGLSAISKMKKRYPTTKALVVCTPEGVKGTWSNEHNKWSHLKHLRVTPLLGSPTKRLELLNTESDVFVITYHNLRWLASVNPHTFDFVFADEGDCLKGATSKWRKSLIDVAPGATWRIISSATPKTREEDDYWGLCRYLDGGVTLGETIKEFRRNYMFERSFNNRRYFVMRKSKIPELEEKIKHLFVNYGLSNQAEIPIKVITYNAELTPESKEKYDTLEKEQCINSLILDDYGRIDQEKSLDALSISAKLDQLSSGFLYVDDKLRISKDQLKNQEVNELVKGSRTVVEVFSDRVDALGKLIKKIHKSHKGEPIVICYQFKHELTQLQSLLPNAVTDKEENFVNRWNNGEIKYLLLQYTRSSKSINLQKGGHIMVFYSPTFKWVDDYQIIRRLARQGQSNELVYAYRLYMKGTVDDVKTKRLNDRFQGHLRFQLKIIKQ